MSNERKRLPALSHSRTKYRQESRFPQVKVHRKGELIVQGTGFSLAITLSQSIPAVLGKVKTQVTLSCCVLSPICIPLLQMTWAETSVYLPALWQAEPQLCLSILALVCLTCSLRPLTLGTPQLTSASYFSFCLSSQSSLSNLPLF